MSKRIYLDHAASTPVNKRIIKEISKRAKDIYGNPSSVHYEGLQSKKLIEYIRERYADFLGCYPEELYFTSGASESNSIAQSLCNIAPLKYHSHDSMVNFNVDIEYDMVSLSYINGLTGELNNIDNIKSDIHLDLTQAVGKLEINLWDMPNVKMASMSLHKIGGLKGCGILYIQNEYKDKIKIKPLINGNQEGGLRGGTENVLGIITSEYLINDINIDKEAKKRILLEKIIRKFCQDNGIKFNSFAYNNYCSGIMNIIFDNIDAQTAVSVLDSMGVAVSAGSACSSGDRSIPEAYKLHYDKPENVIRISFSHLNTIKEIKKFCKILKIVVDKYDKI